MAGLELGARVIRGLDWQWGDQDGGVGHVGTIVLLGHSGLPGCLPGTVMVLWDNGVLQNYRAGYTNAYDLRVLDNSPSGVFHDTVRCDGCGSCGIFGFRWSCRQCNDVDLCSKCYHTKFHDVNHEFVRKLHPRDHGVRVPCRLSSTQTEVFGTFRGAVVVRGRDWEWRDQDGGVGTQGWVKEITNWNDQTGNSVACVIWPGSKENLYRLGHKNKVDLKCVSPASGGKVYASHLPILGKPVDSSRVFLIGKTVEVSVQNIETLKTMQIGHGEFREEMARIIGKRGKVHRITEKGDVRVQFSGEPAKDHRWTLNPLALKVIQGFSLGDKVTITNDKSLIEKYHQNHAALDGFSGCTGTITHVHSDTSLVVDFGAGKVGAVHSAILVQPKQQDECFNINTSFIRSSGAGNLNEVDRILLGSSAPDSQFVILPDNEAILTGLHKAAGKGYLSIVSSILKFRPVLVNQKLQDKTVLMVAAYEGHVNVIDWLVLNGGDAGISDTAGDIPLHYAAIAAKPLAILTLVDKGVPPNSQNLEKRTALHLSVINRNIETVRALLKVGASVNIQDRNGETPLHISINSGCEDISEVLVGQADLLLCDRRGWNPLHTAVHLGNAGLVRMLLREDRRVVNIVTTDGLAPLHIAARGNIGVVKSLLDIPECDVNIQDGRGRSILHYVALNSNLPLLTILLQHRVQVDLQDLDGNTSAHLAVSGTAEPVENPYSNELSDIFEPAHLDRLSYLELSPGQILKVGVLLTILKHGDRDVRNKCGETPTDLIENPELRRFIDEYLVRPEPTGAEHDYAEIVDNTPRPIGEVEPASFVEECRVCSEPNSLITFHPCQHRIVCQDCSLRMKKCLECQVPVERKVMETDNVDDKEARRLRSLEQKVEELEEQFLCGICMERRRNVAFLCGHGACTLCTQGLVNCHMCRTKIERKIPLY